MAEQLLLGIDYEGIAQEVRKRGRVKAGEMVLATRLVPTLLGPEGLAINRRMEGWAYLCRTPNGFQVVANPAAPDIRFHVSHEIGEWSLQVIAPFRGTEAQREQAANRIAAAILAPAAEVRAAYARFGERIAPMAAHFGLSQTSMVLRVAEVRRDERAVVTRSGNVLLRTHGAFDWDAVPVVDVARGKPWRGLAKARLSGGIDEGRVALRAK